MTRGGLGAVGLLSGWRGNITLHSSDESNMLVKERRRVVAKPVGHCWPFPVGLGLGLRPVREREEVRLEGAVGSQKPLPPERLGGMD